MTVTSPEQVTDAHEIVLHDGARNVPVTGWKVAEVSMSFDEALSIRHSRWTDISLYRLKTGPKARQYAKYAIQVTGRSLLYHGNDGCYKGVRMAVGVLMMDRERYDAAIPCPVCQPPDLGDESVLTDQDMVRVESDRHRVNWCRSATEAVDVLYNHNRYDDRPVSGLSMKILTAASSVDPDIAHALACVEGS